MVSEAEYQRLRAKKIDQVPSVTMKGGSFSRVPSTPVTAPQPAPAAMPAISAIDAGSPTMTASLPMITEHRTMIAPTERSMPAGITISVWAIPITPMIVTCWMINDRLKADKKREPTIRLKAATASRSTMAGTAVGLACRKCWSFLSGDFADTSNSATRASRFSRAASTWTPRRPSPTSVIMVSSRVEDRPHQDGHIRVARLAPALLYGGRAIDRGQAFSRLVRHQLHAGIDEIEARRGLWLGAVGGVFLHRFDALGRHQQRKLHRGRADHPILHIAHAGAAAVDRNDQHTLFAADRAQGLIGPGRGRLVDGVDHRDARILLQQILHRLAAALFAAERDIMSDDAGILLVADPGGIADIDAEALEEALIAGDGDRDLIHIEIEQGDLGRRCLRAQGLGGPLADQLAGPEIIGGEGDVRRGRRIERRVERDHQNAGGAGLRDDRHDGA